MADRREYIPMKTRLAAMLLTVRVVEDGNLVPFIDHDTAKTLTPDQIISLFHMDHWPIRKGDGGPDAPWNIVFRPIMEHRVKTAKVDLPEIAKSRKITASHEEFRRRLLAKDAGEPVERRGKYRRKVNGDIVRRSAGRTGRE